MGDGSSKFVGSLAHEFSLVIREDLFDEEFSLSSDCVCLDLEVCTWEDLFAIEEPRDLSSWFGCEDYLEEDLLCVVDRLVPQGDNELGWLTLWLLQSISKLL